MRATYLYGAGDVRVTDAPDPRGGAAGEGDVAVEEAGEADRRLLVLGTVRAYIERLLPAVLDGTVNPGRVFDSVMSVEDTPKAYAAMDARESLKVMVRP